MELSVRSHTRVHDRGEELRWLDCAPWFIDSV